MAVSRTIVLDDLTPQDVADIFCAMNSGDQAAVFNEIGAIASTWPNGGWCVQACEIVRARELSDAGRKVIAALADHYTIQQGEAA